MADANEASHEAAKALVEAILKQSELLGSWALAVFGACVVLVAWYVQRRLDRSSQPMIKSLWLVFVCIFLEGGSILLMYLAYGTMVNIIPDVQFAKLETAEQLRTFLRNFGFGQAQFLFVLQFCTFFVGIVLLGLFALRNYHLVRK
jgi:hypothetical protein